MAQRKVFRKANYGLRREILSPMETLAQSVSTMAPTTTPAATILPEDRTENWLTSILPYLTAGLLWFAIRGRVKDTALAQT